MHVRFMRDSCMIRQWFLPPTPRIFCQFLDAQARTNPICAWFVSNNNNNSNNEDVDVTRLIVNIVIIVFTTRYIINLPFRRLFLGLLHFRWSDELSELVDDVLTRLSLGDGHHDAGGARHVSHQVREILLQSFNSG